MTAEARRLIVSFKTRIAMYERSLRYLASVGASYQEQARWIEKIEKAERAIALIASGVYDSEVSA